MASLICVMSEDQFLCSICLEVFTDPVTAPCGHSFCKICINKHWDGSVQYQCPVCKEEFSVKPQIKVNTFISEMVTQFKKPQNEPAVGPGDVPCDVCSEAKAMKSCLVCLASYCQSHLKNHLTIPHLKRHQLIKPMKNLEDRLCAEHNKTLELFCRDDSKYICFQCTFSDHKNHDAVLLKEEGEREHANVKKLIEERLLKIEEIQKFVDQSKNSERETTKGVEFFNVLLERVLQSLKELKQEIEETKKDKKMQTTEWILELDTEILELEKRKSRMEEMWRSGDHLLFLQTFMSGKFASDVRDWTKVMPRAASYEGTVAKAAAKLRDLLDQEVKELLRNELGRVQQFAKEVTLDPETAHPNLVLSYDHKRVHDSDYEKDLPDNPERFSMYSCVVGKEKLSTGRLYFEVQVEAKTGWHIGMAKESIERKEQLKLKPKHGLWLISLKNNECVAHDDFQSILHLKSIPKKIGVFVDYEEGIVSFYDVDTAELMYSFTKCSFTENLLPLFNPGTNYNMKNIAPLVLTPVQV